MSVYKFPNGLELWTSYDYPPIPYRHFDWSCVDSNYDGAPDAGPQATGHGRTEQEAIFNYLEDYSDLHGEEVYVAS